MRSAPSRGRSARVLSRVARNRDLGSALAGRCGLKPGDVITHINEQPIRSAADVYRLLDGTEQLVVTVRRHTETRRFRVAPEAAA